MDNVHKKNSIALLSLNALGVIYGDIGTSPLYVLSSIFTSAKLTNPSPSDFVGAGSLVIWSLIILVLLKYVIFILLADNVGEGGTFALGGLLIDDKCSIKSGKRAVIIATLIGASFVISDGALTPAISVLSAIEGLVPFNPEIEKYTVIITVIIIICLFMVQRFGTAKVGIVFGPIMLLWFSSLLGIGIYRIIEYPAIFKALNPWEGISYVIRHKTSGFLELGAVFLAVTGLEALYADLGHFGRLPIRISWLFVVFPSLVMNYLGQCAFLITHPEGLQQPFFLSTPRVLYWPMFVLATIATIIASQAMITGCFSLVSQAVSLGFFPAVHVHHTSKKMMGQIYVPEINYILMLITVALVAGFKHSSAIANAYGVTVCGVMVLTTVFYMMLMRYRWNLAIWKVVLFALFLVVDIIFFASNLVKIPSGGWVSIITGSLFSLLMVSWYVGQESVHEYLRTHVEKIELRKVESWLINPGFETLEGEQHDILESGVVELTMLDNHLPVRRNPINTIHGLGIFLTPIESDFTPVVFLNMAGKVQTVPDCIVFLTVEKCPVPFVTDRIKLEEVGNKIFKLTIKAGFAEGKCPLEERLKEARSLGLPSYPMQQTTFYALRLHIKAVNRNWIKRIFFSLYAFQKNLFSGTNRTLKVPFNNIVEIGMLVPL